MPDNLNPKIALPLTTADKIKEALGLVLLFAFWYFALHYYSQLPDVIPTHFNSNGEVDGYGGKWTLFLLSAITTIIYLGITVISRFPHKINYAVPITEANAYKQYSLVTGMFRMMKIAILIVFFIIEYHTVQVALGLPSLLGKWFMLIVFTLVFAPVFYFLIQSSKNA